MTLPRKQVDFASNEDFSGANFKKRIEMRFGRIEFAHTDSRFPLAPTAMREYGKRVLAHRPVESG
jgi:hypothetical protein